MKKTLLALCCLILFSCDKDEIKKPDFMFGIWNRLNDRPGERTYEVWRKDFTGIGFTMKKSDTVFKEILSIITLKDTLYLQVEAVNEAPTLFKFTNQTITSFTCENPQNDFPKKIKYYLESGNLKAVVSNDELSIDFIFNRSL